MNLLIINMMMLLAFIFIFLNHPLSLGLILLIETILIAMITGMMSLNYWFSYILFLIMIGGMLILFIYMTSIASNEKFKFSSKLFISTIPLPLISLLILLDIFFINILLNNDLINQINNMNFKLSMNKFINFPMNNMFYMMIIYLLIALIMVVKVTDFKAGPLRQKN